MGLAYVIPQKGRDEDGYVANLVSEDMSWLGHVKVIRKGGNEVALRALIRRVIDVSRVDGLTIRNAFYWAPRDSFDATIGLDYLQKTGWGVRWSGSGIWLCSSETNDA